MDRVRIDSVKPLVLNLKREYFDAIQLGWKCEEFRLHTGYWVKRLVDMPSGANREFSHIELRSGYPKRGDTKRIMVRPWRGWTLKQILHPHFGDVEVFVFAIVVNEPSTN